MERYSVSLIGVRNNTCQNCVIESPLQGVGYCVAEYNQVSGNPPLSRGDNEIELENGTLVLITGDITTRVGESVRTNPVDALVWREWETTGYGVDVLYFNPDDLRIIY